MILWSLTMKKDLTNFLEEVVDIVNAEDEVIGQADRKTLLTDQTISIRSVRVMIVDDQKRILFQKRSMKKKNMPGMWTTTAAGHVKSGADIPNSAQEELLEETGLRIPLTFVRKLYEEVETRRVWVYIFIGRYDGTPVKLNPDEIQEMRFLNEEEVSELEKTGEKFLKNSLVNAREFWGKNSQGV